eukprot:TRINITY_DN7075_c0_g2_i3.p1 TRINITY_DN7075_c0_g2~~TRINITY_DN7075_c0_g2_i3.p1  ORF type:complete len:107 (-),score=3.29 TRINITY_DN7075_c0_g2_i3:467-787(-)
MPLGMYQVYHCGLDIAGSSTNNAPLISSASFSWSCIRGLGLRPFIFWVKLPVVLGRALSSVLGELSGIVDSLHDCLVLGVEGDGLDDVVHLVPQLGGSEVVIGRYG